LAVRDARSAEEDDRPERLSEQDQEKPFREYTGEAFKHADLPFPSPLVLSSYGGESVADAKGLKASGDRQMFS
jgi:hypothetical protein